MPPNATCWEEPFLCLQQRVNSTVAAAQALWHFRLIRHRERMACFQAFRLNHWLGLTVWLGVALDTHLENVLRAMQEMPSRTA